MGSKFKIFLAILLFLVVIVAIVFCYTRNSSPKGESKSLTIKIIDSSNKPISDGLIVVYRIDKSIFGKLWWQLHEIEKQKTDSSGVINILVNNRKRYSVDVYNQNGRLVEFGDFESRNIDFNKVYIIKCLDTPIMDTVNLNPWLEH